MKTARNFIKIISPHRLAASDPWLGSPRVPLGEKVVSSQAAVGEIVFIKLLFAQFFDYRHIFGSPFFRRF